EPWQACSQQVSALLHTLAQEPGEGAGLSEVAMVPSLPGVGRKITAWLFAEAAQPLAQRASQVLRTHGGGAPVTRQRGKRRQVVMRRGCNPRLRHALYHRARVAMQRAAHFSQVYVALRAKGHRHGQALRTIGDRLLRILRAMLRERICYDASRIHREPVVQMGEKFDKLRLTNGRKSYLRVFRGLSKCNLPGYVGFFQFLRNFHQLTAFEQAEMILYAALEPSIASKAKKGEFVKCLDHFDLLQSARN